MANTGGREDTGGAVAVPSATTGSLIRARRGLRMTLLSLAAVILLLGAAAAGVYGYVTISHGSAAGGGAGRLP